MCYRGFPLRERERGDCMPTKLNSYWPYLFCKGSLVNSQCSLTLWTPLGVMKSGHGCKEKEVNSKVEVGESLRPTLKRKDFSA